MERPWRWQKEVTDEIHVAREVLEKTEILGWQSCGARAPDGGAVTPQQRGLERKDLSLTNITGLHGVSPLT